MIDVFLLMGNIVHTVQFICDNGISKSSMHNDWIWDSKFIL